MGKDLNGKELGKGLRQRSDGKYVARFSCKNGKRPEKAFIRITEARTWLTEQRYLDSHSNIYVAGSLTLNAWYEYWIENIKKPTVREITAHCYECSYNYVIKDVLGNMLLSDIKPLHCQMLLNGISDKAYSYSRKILNCMEQLFNSAVDNEILDKSPITHTVKIAKKEAKERRTFTADEQERFVEFVESRNYIRGDAFLFVLETGLRTAEVVGLRWTDVKDHSITINHSLSYVDKEIGVVDSPPKTRAGKRTIPLTTRAYNIIKKRRSEKVLGQHIFPCDVVPFAPIFDGQLKSICKQIGIKPISMHGLRRSFATRCIEKGMRPKTLQKILGHSTVAMTMDIYVQVTDETLVEEMRLLESGEKVAR